MTSTSVLPNVLARFDPPDYYPVLKSRLMLHCEPWDGGQLSHAIILVHGTHALVRLPPLFVVPFMLPARLFAGFKSARGPGLSMGKLRWLPK